MQRSGSSELRHVVFAAINGVFALLFFRKIRWTIFPFSLLAVQQTWSHGSDLIAAAYAGSFDVQSTLVLLFLPFALGFAASLRTARGTTDRMA
jgi:hypothetical protein